MKISNPGFEIFDISVFLFVYGKGDNGDGEVDLIVCQNSGILCNYITSYKLHICITALVTLLVNSSPSFKTNSLCS